MRRRMALAFASSSDTASSVADMSSTLEIDAAAEGRSSPRVGRRRAALGVGSAQPAVYHQELLGDHARRIGGQEQRGLARRSR